MSPDTRIAFPVMGFLMGLESVYSLPLSCRHLFWSDDTSVTPNVLAGLKYPAGASTEYEWRWSGGKRGRLTLGSESNTFFCHLFL